MIVVCHSGYPRLVPILGTSASTASARQANCLGDSDGGRCSSDALYSRGRSYTCNIANSASPWISRMSRYEPLPLTQPGTVDRDPGTRSHTRPRNTPRRALASRNDEETLQHPVRRHIVRRVHICESYWALRNFSSSLTNCYMSDIRNWSSYMA